MRELKQIFVSRVCTEKSISRDGVSVMKLAPRRRPCVMTNWKRDGTDLQVMLEGKCLQLVYPSTRYADCPCSFLNFSRHLACMSVSAHTLMHTYLVAQNMHTHLHNCNYIVISYETFADKCVVTV